MEIGSLIELLGPYGPTGLIIAYLLYREHRRDQREERREERDEKIRQDQAEADKELATALALLSERINVRAV